MLHQNPAETAQATIRPSGSRFLVRSRLIAFLLLLGSIVAVYSNTLDVPWHFDDRRNIVERQDLHLTELSWAEIKDTFFYGKRFHRPVACLSFALNHYFHQLDLAGYHVDNIAVHVLAAWFLFLFIKVALKSPLTQTFYRNKALFIAFVASLLWALHPMQTQSVTYIVQRMAGLAGLFYIMSMYFYARGRIPENGRKKWIFFFLSTVAALLALGSKENAILLPFSIALYELFVLNQTPLKSLLKSHWKFLVLFLAFMAVAMFGYLALYYGGRVSSFLSGYQNRIFSLEERLLTQPRIIIFYISLLIYPHPSRLSIFHDVELSASLFQPISTILSIGAIALLVTGAVILRRKHPLVAFSVLFFFLNHTIESTIIPLELIFEHRNYIPSMTFFLPFAMLFAQGLFHPKTMPAVRGSAIGLVVALPILLGSATYVRNFDWKSGQALWMDAASKSPNTWRPFHNVGAQFLKEEDYPQALNWFKRALGKKNTTGRAEKHQTLYEMGVAYQAMGLADAALAAYRLADEMYPGVAKVHVNMGVILMNQEDWNEALGAFKEALSIDPSLPEAHSNLGWLMFKSGDPENGIYHLRKAVQLKPADLVTVQRLAYALLRQGNYSEAERLLQGLRRDEPKDLSSLLFLAEVYVQTGRIAKAKNAVRSVARLIGENGLSRLRLIVLEQEDRPTTMLPAKDILIPILEGLEVESGLSPGTQPPDTFTQKNTGDHQ